MDKDLYNLQCKLEKEKRPKKKVKGTGFAKQKQIMEQSGYYIKSKKKKDIKLIDKRKK